MSTAIDWVVGQAYLTRDGKRVICLEPPRHGCNHALVEDEEGCATYRYPDGSRTKAPMGKAVETPQDVVEVWPGQ